MATSRGSGLRWLLWTAILATPRRSRHEPAHWVPGALALAGMLCGFATVTMSVGLPDAARWTGLGFSIVVFATGAGLALLRIAHRRAVFAAAGWAIVALASWTIVASALPLGPETARWVILGSGVGYVVDSIIALIAHELSPGRVVHVLEVRPSVRGA